MPKQFTDADTEKYYNTVETQYEIPWNPDGSKHWGYFDNLDAPDVEEELFRASDRWNEFMLGKSGIDAKSRVLDVGCGNGHTAIFLANQINCEVVGIDISQTHVNNAKEKAQSFPDLNLSFEKASATDLPFPDKHFTHIWSQGTLLHIHQRDVALKEFNRILSQDGTLIFDDLLTLVPQVSESTLKYVYERMQLTQLFSPKSYADALIAAGFQILDALDVSPHMQKFYTIQAKRVREQYEERSVAYEKTREAAVAGEIGWWFFLCQKS